MTLTLLGGFDENFQIKKPTIESLSSAIGPRAGENRWKKFGLRSSACGRARRPLDLPCLYDRGRGGMDLCADIQTESACWRPWREL